MVINNNLKRGARTLTALVSLALAGATLAPRDVDATLLDSYTTFRDNSVMVGMKNNTGREIGRLDFSLPKEISEYLCDFGYDDSKWNKSERGDDKISFVSNDRSGGLDNNKTFKSFYEFPKVENMKDFFKNPLIGVMNAYGRDGSHLGSTRFGMPNFGGYGGSHWGDITCPTPPMDVNPVPEPSTLVLAGIALTGLAGYRLREEKKKKKEDKSS